MAEIKPINLASLRFIIAGIIFVPLIYRSQKKLQLQIETSDWPKLLLLAFLGVTSYFWVQYTGLSLTTATNASLILATAPIFVAILASWQLGEKLSREKTAGIILAFIGVIGVVANGSLASLFDSKYLAGNLLMLFNAMCWATFTITSKKMTVKYSPLIVTGYITMLGGLMFVPIGMLNGVLDQVTTISGIGWLVIMFLAIFCSIGGYLGWQYALSKVEATKTAIFLYLQPLVTVLVAILLLGEKLTGLTVLGGALILSGVTMTMKERKRGGIVVCQSVEER